MSNNIIRLKQFTVTQDKCAMKVSTDGILLGAWAKPIYAQRILDIGTGTGILALMMAQKAPAVLIDAIDIDILAVEEASENFHKSPWKGKLHAIHTHLQTFTPAYQYNFIISNPPYFTADLKTPDARKNVAKHNAELSYKELAEGISKLLAPDGKAALMIPVFNLNLLKQVLADNKLYVNTIAFVTAVQDKRPPYLVLVEIETQQTACKEEHIYIRNSDYSFNADYLKLTADFYLNLLSKQTG